MCCLCKKEEESAVHLVQVCEFTSMVWEYFKRSVISIGYVPLLLIKQWIVGSSFGRTKGVRKSGIVFRQPYGGVMEGEE